MHNEFASIELICSDIDGTVLNKSNVLPEELKKEIWRLYSQGIFFTFSTGRLPYEVDDLFEGIPYPVPYVAGNGAVIKFHDTIIEEHYFTAEKLKDIAYQFSKLGVTVIFSLNNEERVLFRTEWSLANEHIFPGMSKIVDDSIWEIPLQRMFFYHPEGAYLAECMEELRKFEDSFSVSFQNAKSIQIAPHACTKASGVKTIADMLKIPESSILCVGDSDNDLPMIYFAGIGAAVSNATDELKAAADHVTLNPCAAGVVELLEKCGQI